MIRINVRSCGELIGTLPVSDSRAYDGSAIAFWPEQPRRLRLPAPGHRLRPVKIPDVLHLTIMTFTDITAEKSGERHIDEQLTFHADAPEMVAKVRRLAGFQPLEVTS